ncbi:MAG: glycosyltransferase [Pseudomonadota bacterium]|jgi:Glycosyltransferase|nr:glycosyltransferase [Pseudomonadota bacterium]
MKILHLIDSGGLYGAEKMLLALVRVQLDQGMAPMILSAGDLDIEEKPLEAEAKRQGLPVTAWRMKPGLNLVQSWKILKWARANGYQLLHSHGFKFNVLLGCYPRFIRGIPMVATLHGYLHAPRFTKLWVYELLDRLAISLMQRVVLVGDAMSAELPSRLALSEKVWTIRNGLPIDEVVKRSESELPEDFQQFFRQHNAVILGVGRLSREKGFDHLIMAFREIQAKNPNVGLMIVGEGNKRPELEALVNKYGLGKHVVIPGYFDNIPALMAKSSVLAISSLTEGLPITLLEALAVRLPVVSTSVGEIPNVLNGGSHGLLVKDVSENRLSKAILQVLEDPGEALKRADSGFRMLCGKFSATAMAGAYIGVYENVAT